MYVEVELIGEYTRGATVGDIYGYLGRKPNAACIMDIDREAFIELLIEAVVSYGKGMSR
jgi:pyrimidine-specific ribonucleoside hydrolase